MELLETPLEDRIFEPTGTGPIALSGTLGKRGPKDFGETQEKSGNWLSPQLPDMEAIEILEIQELLRLQQQTN